MPKADVTYGIYQTGNGRKQVQQLGESALLTCFLHHGTDVSFCSRPISWATSLHATCLTMLRIYNQPTTPSSSSCVPVVFLSRNALHKRFRSLPEATHANSPAIGHRGPAGALRTVPGYQPPA